MIKSEFIKNILQLLIDEQDVPNHVKEQFPFLIEQNEVEYTSNGAFYTFDYEKGIESFKLTYESNPLNGVEIFSPELSLGAEAILHFKEGFISYLEVWSHGGDYPARELKIYTLRQAWKGSAGKKIEVRL